jgi:integrase
MAKRKRRNGVYYREDRQRWGYQVYLRGVSYKRYAWGSRAEARAALIELKKDIESRPEEPRLPSTALITVVNDYLADSAEDGRSKWRIDGARWNFGKVIIPHFGAPTVITSITTDQIKKMVLQRKRDGKKPKTLWHDFTNLRALLNYAIKKELLKKNPADALDTSIIGSTRSKKSPLNLPAVDRAADSIQNPSDRAYFDFLRYTGLRKDEANRLRWDDINFDEGWFHCRGTKTDESDAYLPMAPALAESLKRHKASSKSEYVFPGRSARTAGKRIYSRRRMFEKIELLTASCDDCGAPKIANRRHCLSCKQVESVSRVHRCSKCRSTNVIEGIGCTACGSANVRKGVKLRPKDLRDYFASTVQTDDPGVLMSLMRHTNLTTTTKYLRAKQEAMKEAVSGMGQTYGKTLGESLGETQNPLPGQKTTPNGTWRILEELIEDELTQEDSVSYVSGGGQIRTVDAADMSRVL